MVQIDWGSTNPETKSTNRDWDLFPKPAFVIKHGSLGKMWNMLRKPAIGIFPRQKGYSNMAGSEIPVLIGFTWNSSIMDKHEGLSSSLCLITRG